MNCKQARSEIFQLEELELPPPVLAAHIESCKRCARLHDRLSLAEATVREMPSPKSNQDAFVDLFLLNGPAVIPFRPNTALSNRPRKERGKKKLAAAFAMASTLLFCALGWWLLPVPRNTHLDRHPGSPLQVRLTSNENWVRAREPMIRLPILDEVSRDLVQEATMLARERSFAKLKQTVAEFRELVDQHLIPNAMRLPRKQRQQAFPMLADRMARTESTMAGLAAEHPSAAPYLREIAMIAQAADQRLRKMLKT